MHASGMFNMAYLAARGALLSFGVSRLHGAFQPADFSAALSALAGARGAVRSYHQRCACADLGFRHGRCDLDRGMRQGSLAPRARGYAATHSRPSTTRLCGRCVARRAQAWCASVRARLTLQLRGRGHPPEVVALGETVLDPNVLTLGFARRFTDYKRPDLLLFDRARLTRMLCDEARPVQLVLAGKAHPDDAAGKRMIQEWIEFAQDPRYAPPGGVPRGLRHYVGAGTGAGRGCLDQHAAPAVGGMRYQRHESAGQRRPQPVDVGWLVGGSVRTRTWLGDRR